MNQSSFDPFSNSRPDTSHLPRILLSLLFLFLFGQLSAQYSLHGTISNAEGDPLPGATVQLENQPKITSSDAKGLFNLEGIRENKVTLVVTYVGFRTYHSALLLVPGRNDLAITLEGAAVLTEDVIVSATRAGNKTPVAYTNLDVSNLTEKQSGQDLPYLLSLTPLL